MNTYQYDPLRATNIALWYAAYPRKIAKTKPHKPDLSGKQKQR